MNLVIPLQIKMQSALILPFLSRLIITPYLLRDSTIHLTIQNTPTSEPILYEFGITY